MPLQKEGRFILTWDFWLQSLLLLSLHWKHWKQKESLGFGLGKPWWFFFKNFFLLIFMSIQNNRWHDGIFMHMLFFWVHVCVAHIYCQVWGRAIQGPCQWWALGSPSGPQIPDAAALSPPISCLEQILQIAAKSPLHPVPIHPPRGTGWTGQSVHKNCYDVNSLFHHLAVQVTFPFYAKQQFLDFLME